MSPRDPEERFRLIAETISEVFWMGAVGPFQILYVSPGYERIWGYSCASAYEHPSSFLTSIHPDDRKAMQASLATKERNAILELDYRIVRPDGEVRSISDRGYPVADADGVVTHYCGVAQDVTERKRLEAQLRHAQKMEAIGQLAGGVAHDFNNIMQAMVLEISVMSRLAGLPERARDHLTHLRACADRAAGLTRQLLVFSRREVMQSRLLDLSAAVTDLAHMLRRTLGEDIALHLDLAAGNLCVHADPGMLDQVFMNMALNARDAMPGGGVLAIATALVDIAAGPGRRPGRHVRVTLSDTGVGIPAEVVPRIFEPFFTTKELGRGSGLGLATAFGIVEQHGGWIEVNSEPGRGTRLHTYLPAADGASAAVTRDTAVANPRGSEGILVVEDDAAVRTLMRAVLEQHGYQVLEADSGGSALRVWTEAGESIDLVITDLVMPGGMDGRELARRLEACRPGVKVVFATGHDRLLAEHDAVAGQTLLQKPVTAEHLLAVVRAHLDG